MHVASSGVQAVHTSFRHVVPPQHGGVEKTHDAPCDLHGGGAGGGEGGGDGGGGAGGDDGGAGGKGLAHCGQVAQFHAAHLVSHGSGLLLHDDSQVAGGNGGGGAGGGDGGG